MIRITKDGAERLLLKLDVEEETHGRMSAWSKGVYDYARWMIRPILDNEVEDGREFESMKDYCLNGAQGFKELSYNGNYYIYDEDIANQLATRSERRYSKVDGRLLPPAQFKGELARRPGPGPLSGLAKAREALARPIRRRTGGNIK